MSYTHSISVFLIIVAILLIVISQLAIAYNVGVTWFALELVAIFLAGVSFFMNSSNE